MKNDWEVFEKIMSVIQVLIGFIIIALLIWSVNLNLNRLFEFFDYTWEDVSVIKLIKNNHFTALLGVIAIIGGVGWFFYKTLGWLLSFMFWFLLGFTITLGAFKELKQEPNVHIAIEEYWIYYSSIFASFFMSVLLFLSFFWTKYKPKKKQLIIFGIIFLVLVIDRTILSFQ